ncbi:MAG: helix-hairpin-helix domain-containing protein [Syntrophobacteraceae bacterium]
MNRKLRVIPGVGPSIAKDLEDLGFHCVEDLRGADPEAMYMRLNALRGSHVDRCMLYVFRCAVYFASHEVHDPERLKWWNWKDAKPRRLARHETT